MAFVFFIIVFIYWLTRIWEYGDGKKKGCYEKGKNVVWKWLHAARKPDVKGKERWSGIKIMSSTKNNRATQMVTQLKVPRSHYFLPPGRTLSRRPASQQSSGRFDLCLRSRPPSLPTPIYHTCSTFLIFFYSFLALFSWTDHCSVWTRVDYYYISTFRVFLD